MQAARQPGLAPENLTTFAHFSVSPATNFPNSLGESGCGVPPRSTIRVETFGSARPAFTPLLMVSMISAGVPCGAPRPAKAEVSKPGTNSATVGMSGKAGSRAGEQTASRAQPADPDVLDR